MAEITSVLVTRALSVKVPRYRAAKTPVTTPTLR